MQADALESRLDHEFLHAGAHAIRRVVRAAWLAEDEPIVPVVRIRRTRAQELLDRWMPVKGESLFG